MKELLTPRGYLSATAIEMWITNRPKYEDRYFRGNDEETFENPFMVFGKKVATALETGEKTGDEVTDMVISSIPRYKNIEHEIMVPFRTKNGTVNLLGKLDTFEEKPLHFREYKTGKVKWTMFRAVNARQSLHYDLLIWLKYHEMASERHLDWFETKLAGKEIQFTGKVEHFQVARSFANVLSYMALVSRVAKEIDEAYRNYLDQIKI